MINKRTYKIGDAFKTNTGNWLVITAFEYEYIITELYECTGELKYDRHITYAGILDRYEQFNGETFKILYGK